MKAALGLFCVSLLPLQAQAGTISLSAERNVFRLGEPVYLRMESGSARPPALEAGETVLIVSTPDSGEFRYEPPMRYRFRSGDTNSQEPRIRFARLIAHREGLLFRKPGRYRLRVVSPSSHPLGPSGRINRGEAGFRVLSDTLDLVIAEPVGPNDKRALALVARNPGEYALAVYLEGGGQLKAGMAIIRDLAGFPNYLRRTASFVLSSDWSQDYAGLDGGAPRSLDLAKSLSFAQWDREPGAYIPLRNAFRLRQAVEIVSRNEANSPVLRETLSRLGKFEASLSEEERIWYLSL